MTAVNSLSLFSPNWRDYVAQAKAWHTRDFVTEFGTRYTRAPAIRPNFSLLPRLTKLRFVTSAEKHKANLPGFKQWWRYFVTIKIQAIGDI